MSYDVTEVNQFLNKAIRALGGKPKIQKGGDWQTLRAVIKDKANDYKGAKSRLSIDELKPYFVEFLIAISNAQQYVCATQQLQQMRQNVLNDEITFALQECDQFGELQALPKPENVDIQDNTKDEMDSHAVTPNNDKKNKVVEVNAYLNAAIRKLGGKPQIHTGESWQAEKTELEEKEKDYKEAKSRLSIDELKPYFVEFLIAVSNAQQYAHATPEYQSMLKETLDIAITTALQEADDFPELDELKRPVYVMPANLTSTGTSLEPNEESEILGFLASKEMRALRNHQSLLNYDTRIHACRVEKGDTLLHLIRTLDAQTTMAGIQDTLRDFYSGEGVIDQTTKQESPYEILNKGQGLVTRFLGFFSTSSHTTTLKLIDNLAKTVGVGHRDEQLKLN